MSWTARAVRAGLLRRAGWGPRCADTAAILGPPVPWRLLRSMLAVSLRTLQAPCHHLCHQSDSLLSEQPLGRVISLLGGPKWPFGPGSLLSSVPLWASLLSLPLPTLGARLLHSALWFHLRLGERAAPQSSAETLSLPWGPSRVAVPASCSVLLLLASSAVCDQP